MLDQPMTFYGYKVLIEQDRPKLQLGEAVKEFLTPEQIDDHNAWMLSFFGASNWMKDGEYFLNDMFRSVHMNPRTYERFRYAMAQVPA